MDLIRIIKIICIVRNLCEKEDFELRTLKQQQRLHDYIKNGGDMTFKQYNEAQDYYENFEYPCKDQNCFERGNYHTGCENCPQHK